jgi:chemotaxis protein CheD
MTRTPGRSTVFLQPGQYFVGTGCRVRTLLGSCVSITLWHPRLRVGAMSHFLLWSRRSSGQAVDGALDGRYGDEVLSLMQQQLAALGVRSGDCEGKLFGGGDMFPAQSTGNGNGGIGQRNGSAARAMLQAQGIRLVSESLFGVGHRQIDFDLATGNVLSRQIPPNSTLGAAHCQAAA